MRATTEDNTERLLLQRLREGDESAFGTLIDRYHQSLIRVALLYVRDTSVAEEVAQETWVAVLRGLDRFEGRSSLKTWLFSILANRAKTRGQREGRYVSLTSMWEDADDGGSAVEPERFHPQAGYWLNNLPGWDDIPEERMLSQEVRACIREAINRLPPNQRMVITLRDLEGWDAESVCSILEISDNNQRVLLHRARSKVHRALERYFAD